MTLRGALIPTHLKSRSRVGQAEQIWRVNFQAPIADPDFVELQHEPIDFTSSVKPEQENLFGTDRWMQVDGSQAVAGLALARDCS
jgi:hypothetical protein